MNNAGDEDELYFSALSIYFNASDSLPTKFIWTIQTLDDNKQPVLQTDGNGESRSEPFIFSISSKK